MSTKQFNHEISSENRTNALLLLGCAAGAIGIVGYCLHRKYHDHKVADEPSAKILHLSNEHKSQIKSDHDALDHGQNIGDKALSRDSVYRRLHSSILPKNNFYFQYASNEESSLVTAINLLVEYLPNDIIQILFLYIPDQPKNFDVSNYLQHGWQPMHQIIHDYPTIYVENILPIQNQPSLILTIGLPGSGKTTWAKIRTPCDKYVIAADDYFDKFNDGHFDASLLQKAHTWAQQKVHDALKNGHTVVANNTNTTLPEMHAYVMKVLFAENIHKIVFAVMPETHISTLTKRGLHGVNARKCGQMLRRMRWWMDKKPPSILAVLKAGAFRRGNPKGVSKDVIYSGIFMNKQTQDKIRKYFVSVSGKPVLCHLTDCHLTLKFRPLEEDVQRLSFGKKVFLKLVGYASHEYVQCFLVDILDDSIRKLCINQYPHITISLNKAYVRPHYANELLSHGQIVPTINNLDVLNTEQYTNLYRNAHDNKGGGLIVEGRVGGFVDHHKPGTVGVSFERPNADDKHKKNIKQHQGKENHEDQKFIVKKKRRRGGRNRNKSKK